MPRIGFVGDCCSHNLTSIDRSRIPKRIVNAIQECDVLVYNLEGPLANQDRINVSDENILIEAIGKKLGIAQPTIVNSPKLLNELDISSEQVVCLANNHLRDRGNKGVLQTLNYLSEYKTCSSVGAGKNAETASEPVLLDVDGYQIGINNINLVGWTVGPLHYDRFGARDNRPGANYQKKRDILDDVQKLGEEADLVYTVLHAGNIFEKSLPNWVVELVDRLPNQHTIIHHPHIHQDINRRMASSCGDFIFKIPGWENTGSLAIIEGERIIDKLKFKIVDGYPSLYE